MKFTAEQIKKASACGSADELAAYAKSEGIELTAEEAVKYFAAVSAKELSPDELDDVSGGKFPILFKMTHKAPSGEPSDSDGWIPDKCGEDSGC